MNVISNRELHLRKFEKGQKPGIETGTYPKQIFDTAVIVDFQKFTKKRGLDVRVGAL
ncbi:hypothetical protein [Oribacterium sp. P6A1]|uniref:hypothetical protein n=1 Tax=Oribacterium sp. P6A1 TaxID=1410612 RepID=UPI000ACE7614|nr:hypothetical protein [Oribacterium sp. P6A1]